MSIGFGGASQHFAAISGAELLGMGKGDITNLGVRDFAAGKIESFVSAKLTGKA